MKECEFEAHACGAPSEPERARGEWQGCDSGSHRFFSRGGCCILPLFTPARLQRKRGSSSSSCSTESRREKSIVRMRRARAARTLLEGQSLSRFLLFPLLPRETKREQAGARARCGSRASPVRDSGNRCCLRLPSFYSRERASAVLGTRKVSDERGGARSFGAASRLCRQWPRAPLHCVFFYLAAGARGLTVRNSRNGSRNSRSATLYTCLPLDFQSCARDPRACAPQLYLHLWPSLLIYLFIR